MSDPTNPIPSAGPGLNSDPWDQDYNESPTSADGQESADDEQELAEVPEADGDDAGERSEGEDGEEEGPAEEEPSEEQKESASKKIMARLGDKVFEMPADAMVTVKVRGQDVQMTAQEAINRASGDYDIQNKYNELNTEKQRFGSKIKSWEKESAEWNSFSKDVVGKITSKDPNRVIEGFDQIVERMGGDPIMFKSEFVKSLLPLVQKYQNMTESERALYDRDLQIEAERKIRERETAKLQRQIAEREEQDFNRSVEAEAVEGMQKYGVSEDEFVAAYERAKSLKEAGHIKGDISPKDVIFIAVEDRVRDQFKSGIASISESIASDKASYEKYENALLDRVLFDMTRGSLNTVGYYKEWLRKEIAGDVKVAVNEKTKHSRSFAKKPGPKKREYRDTEVFDKNLKINWD